MLNRRQFVQIVTLAGVATTLRAIASGATESEPQAPPTSQPQSFVALPAPKGQTRAVTSEEQLARMERACGLMLKQGLGATVLTGGTSLVYYTNLR